MSFFSIKPHWDRLWRQVSEPRVSPEKLEECLEEIKKRLPIPVFWLLGKTQAGKSSIICALTGTNKAAIGTGFRPCTRTAQQYPYPNDEDCRLRFLDTRGLGEVSYDPAEDIAQFQDQAHLLVLVMKAMDHAQKPVLDAFESIHAARPQWPVLVVQTSLHEGYPGDHLRHPLPYPFAQSPLPGTIPQDLTRSLLMQRKMFEKFQAPIRFVAVDFTLPEDGFEPALYGLDELWQSIEELVPYGLHNMLRQDGAARDQLADIHYQTALPHVTTYAVAAGTASLIPLPFVDVPVVAAIQMKMFHTVANIYRQEINAQRIGEILGTLGVGMLGQIGSRGLLKFIPVFGSAMTALYTAAATYALGLTLCAYFARIRDGAVPNQEELRELYRAHFDEGREKLKSYLDSVRK